MSVLDEFALGHEDRAELGSVIGQRTMGLIGPPFGKILGEAWGCRKSVVWPRCKPPRLSASSLASPAPSSPCPLGSEAVLVYTQLCAYTRHARAEVAPSCFLEGVALRGTPSDCLPSRVSWWVMQPPRNASAVWPRTLLSMVVRRDCYERGGMHGPVSRSFPGSLST